MRILRIPEFIVRDADKMSVFRSAIVWYDKTNSFAGKDEFLAGH